MHGDEVNAIGGRKEEVVGAGRNLGSDVEALVNFEMIVTKSGDGQIRRLQKRYETLMDSN